MTSSSLFSTNDKIDNNSIKNNKNDKLYNESITSFKAFDSVLFMNEFLGYDEYQISEKSAKDNQNKINLSHNSNEKRISKNIQDIKISPTLEKCLTTELLNSITNDSNKNQKCQHPNFISGNFEKQKDDIEKILLLNQNDFYGLFSLAYIRLIQSNIPESSELINSLLNKKEISSIPFYNYSLNCMKNLINNN